MDGVLIDFASDYLKHVVGVSDSTWPFKSASICVTTDKTATIKSNGWIHGINGNLER